ncbi:MAG: preprotein translocase subunit SecG [Candidatus Azobacteroides sp.]|nr:preprotein translocase subunit SecG [Candidatus Azobacteroides sp.]
MYIFISIVSVIVALLLVLVVVIQNSKGGGLASSFASSNQIMGVRKTNDVVEKITWWLAGALVGLSIVASLALPRHHAASESIIKEDVMEKTMPAQEPSTPSFGDPILNDSLGAKQK